MTDRILLRHLAPVRHVPRGGRTDRWSLVPIETPATLPTVSASEVVQVAEISEGGYVQNPVRVFGHGGRLWLPAGSADTMRAVIGGIAHPSAINHRQGDCFRGNPWAAQRHLAIEPSETLESRKVGDDRRDVASAEAARFVSRDLLVAGETAFTRLRGPMLIPVAEDFSTPHFAPVPFIRHRVDSGWTTVASLARAPAVLEHVGTALGRPRTEAEAALPVLAGIDPEAAGIEDIRLMAALLAWRGERMVESSLRSDPHADATRDQLREARAGLSKWAVSGALGMIATDEIERALAGVARTMDLLRESVPGIERADTRIRHATAYVTRVAMPALQAAKRTAGDDADALIALAP